MPKKADSGDSTVPFHEVARRLCISVRMARKAAQLGQIPAVLVGKRLKVLRAPFEAWLSQQKGADH